MKRRRMLQVLGLCAPVIGKPVLGHALGRDKKSQESLKGPFIVESRFKSLIYPEKIYATVEEFWLDHELPSDHFAFANLLKVMGISGRKLSRCIDSKDSKLVIKTAYKSKDHYLCHLNLFNDVFSLPYQCTGKQITSQLSCHLEVTDSFG